MDEGKLCTASIVEDTYIWLTLSKYIPLLLMRRASRRNGQRKRMLGLNKKKELNAGILKV